MSLPNARFNSEKEIMRLSLAIKEYFVIGFNLKGRPEKNPDVIEFNLNIVGVQVYVGYHFRSQFERWPKYTNTTLSQKAVAAQIVTENNN
jgi:hypothetical protein